MTAAATNKDLYLAFMCRSGNLNAVRELIRHGADVNAFDGLAMSHALEFGHAATVVVLIGAGATVTAEHRTLAASL